MRLTDITIQTLKPPPKGVAYYTDDLLTGFGVRVSEGGAKSFVLTHGTLRRRETIGRVGTIGLKAARKEAQRRLAEYTLGKATPASITWKEAVALYQRYDYAKEMREAVVRWEVHIRTLVA